MLLPDCGHTIEVDGLTNWMQQDEDVVAMKTCPRCKSEIRRVPRFNNVVKQVYKDITKVKSKTFGNLKTIDNKRMKLEQDMAALLAEDIEGKLVFCNLLLHNWVYIKWVLTLLRYTL